MRIKELLNRKISTAMKSAGIVQERAPQISRSKHPKGGDFQANGVLAAARILETAPRKLALKVIENLALEEIADKVEVSGPGFINIHLSDDWIGKTLSCNNKKENLGIETAQQPQIIVVDYSAPNLAKEMHVGHLRSTIIGDAQVRLLEYIGHKVIRQNHIGDWGTQFGMLIAELEQVTQNEQVDSIELKGLEAFYQQSKKHFDENESFANKARDYVVKLQSGDEHALKLWKQFIELSLSHADAIYRKLNVSLTQTDVMGESSYNADLPVLVEELKQRGLVDKNEGAEVAFLEELSDKDGKASPVIVQKRGGGYLYSTTDLAAIRHRVFKLKADSILYFIDVRQSLHMSQIFTLARKASFLPEHVQLKHCAFGTMMGKDGKPFKTRSGGVIRLESLIDEAIKRARTILEEKENDLSEKEAKDVARKVGIGAIKYADLSKARINDYTFDWDAMLSFSGNTAPYLQYAYTRIVSLLRKAQTNIADAKSDIQISHEKERELAIQLLSFEDILNKVSKEAMPHFLCNYLYELSKKYMRFYENCPINSDDVCKDIKMSRLALCSFTAKTLKTGLKVLGIEVMEKM